MTLHPTSSQIADAGAEKDGAPGTYDPTPVPYAVAVANQPAPAPTAGDSDELNEAEALFSLAADDFECDPTADNKWLMDRRWGALQALKGELV